MDFDYTPNGGFDVFGCADVLLVQEWTHAYDVGDVVYSKPSALRGLLRRHCIKTVRTRAPGFDRWDVACRSCKYQPLYEDTLNAYHNEEDLIAYDEAIAWVEWYNERQAALATDAAKDC